jgi:hypothetical protein
VFESQMAELALVPTLATRDVLYLRAQRFNKYSPSTARPRTGSTQERTICQGNQDGGHGNPIERACQNPGDGFAGSMPTPDATRAWTCSQRLVQGEGSQDEVAISLCDQKCGRVR